LAPERSAASAPSIAAWRRTASNLSRTAGSIMLGRSGFRAGGARAFRLRLLAEAFANFAQDGRSGIASENRGGNDAAARGFHFLAANNLVAGPVAALDEDIGKEPGDHFTRRKIVKDHDGVHRFQ